MLDFRSYKVSVRVNDQDVPIYRPEYDEDTKTATCWIASEEGQAFTIFCQQAESFRYTSSAEVCLDGSRKPATGIVLGKGRNYFGHITGVRVSQTSRRPFEFASLETTDDDAYLDQPLGLKAPGTIHVQMSRVRVTRDSVWKPRRVPEAASIVHEKSKKAGGHITRLGKQEVAAPAPKPIKHKPYHPSDIDPWVSFEFRYRPAAILQAEGIMPKPQASQNNSPHEDDDDEMEAEHKAEILALEAEQAALDARRAALKAKAKNINIKREASPIRVPRNTVAGVIDLTLEYVRIYFGGDSTGRFTESPP
ncbi:hypothetical protein FRC05_003795 [Tulasnella sp. 425]|nr:hypothetical protein FRC05_003795 [Tulasnella sp. 425]